MTTAGRPVFTIYTTTPGAPEHAAVVQALRERGFDVREVDPTQPRAAFNATEFADEEQSLREGEPFFGLLMPTPPSGEQLDAAMRDAGAEVGRLEGMRYITSPLLPDYPSVNRAQRRAANKRQRAEHLRALRKKAGGY